MNEMFIFRYTGLCMALQAKVAFLHHQWAYPNVLDLISIYFYLLINNLFQVVSMAISVFGMLIYYVIVSVSVDDYWYVGQTTMNQGIFWFYGMFSVPLFAVFVDWIGFFIYVFFWPSKETLFREIEHKVWIQNSCL
jgi:hypothetical protein